MVEALSFLLFNVGLHWILLAAWFLICAVVGMKLPEHIWEG